MLLSLMDGQTKYSMMILSESVQELSAMATEVNRQRQEVVKCQWLKLLSHPIDTTELHRDIEELG